MDTKGRKLFRYVAGLVVIAFLMGTAYTTTAMASSIGLIDTADLLDIHAEADSASEVVGQVMDEGHVAILARDNGWVQIQAGDIIGWVPEANLIETEVSNEEAVEANQEVIAEWAEEAEGTEETEDAEVTEDTEDTEDTEATESTVSAEDTIQTEAAVPAEGTAQTEAAVPAEGTAQTEDTAEADSEGVFAAETIRKTAEAAQKQAEEAAYQQALAAQKQAEEAAKAAQEAARIAAEEAQARAAAEARKQAILAANNITEEDLYLLANIIYTEAGCEPYIGKVAVGNVVMNRVKSDRQPDTIREVIYAKGQFSPVANGSLERALRRNSADESCYQAALDALAGAQPVGDKLFFRRVNGRPGQIIGHHVFY